MFCASLRWCRYIHFVRKVFELNQVENCRFLSDSGMIVRHESKSFFSFTVLQQFWLDWTVWGVLAPELYAWQHCFIAMRAFTRIFICVHSKNLYFGCCFTDNVSETDSQKLLHGSHSVQEPSCLCNRNTPTCSLLWQRSLRDCSLPVCQPPGRAAELSTAPPSLSLSPASSPPNGAHSSDLMAAQQSRFCRCSNTPPHRPFVGFWYFSSRHRPQGEIRFVSGSFCFRLMDGVVPARFNQRGEQERLRARYISEPGDSAPHTAQDTQLLRLRLLRLQLRQR